MINDDSDPLLALCADDPARSRWRRIAANLPHGEHWRALGSGVTQGLSGMRWLALDIETTGIAPPNCHVTVVGLCGHATDFEPIALVADSPGWEQQLAAYLEQSDVLVTFNGRGFDVPFLCRTLRWSADVFPPFHVDLCPLWRHLGHRGGLKKVQVQLGFHRPGQLADVDGYTAVLLWSAYRRGHPAALLTLVRYCLEDVVVLLPMAALAYERMAVELGRSWKAPALPTVSVDHLPYDEELARRLGNRTRWR